VMVFSLIMMGVTNTAFLFSLEAALAGVMTGSRLIAGMQQVLVQFFQIAPHCEKTEASAERIIWEHRELLNAIRDRDVERARAMIRLQFRATLKTRGVAAK